MSLINEALKKAQPERPVAPNTPPPPPSQGEHYQTPRKKKRGYLWGFLMAVLLVGLFSAIVSTFLVYQILGDETGETASKESPAETSAPVEAGTVWEKLPEEPASEPVVASVSADATEPAITTPVAAVETVEPAKPVEPVAAAVEQTVTAAPPAKPNPAVWARLQELEIRGIMSGGNKVLIFDLSTGKTKSYKPGDILDGSLALTISSIESGEILFEDYGGTIHTKSF
jgi:cytoskeletal protein RodZ